jgi:hypothetical protein
MIISELPADPEDQRVLPAAVQLVAEVLRRSENNPSAATATTSVHEALDKMPSVLRSRGERGRHPELQGFVRSGRGHHKCEHSFHNQKEK